ncbi:MAG: DUF2249 domain-containing protein [Alphaproteobacteria bacterium]
MRAGNARWESRQPMGKPDRSETTRPEGAPEGARFWRQGDDVHIDVRGLEPPGPMLAILAWIESPRTAGRALVHLDREPIFLYPELAERAWSHEIVPGEPGEVLLRLRSRSGE